MKITFDLNSYDRSCHISARHDVSQREKKYLGPYSLSGKTSYRKISWSLEAARFGFKLFQSLWNLAGTSAALLPRCLSNFRAIRQLQHPISRLRVFTRFGGKTSYCLVNRGPEYDFLCSIFQHPQTIVAYEGHIYHIEAGTKWLIFRRQYFEMQLSEEKFWFIEICFRWRSHHWFRLQTHCFILIHRSLVALVIQGPWQLQTTVIRRWFMKKIGND